MTHRIQERATSGCPNAFEYMTSEIGKIITTFLLAGLAFAAATTAAAQNRQSGVLYRVSLGGDRAKTIAVVQSGKKINLRLDGFERAATLAATGGGTETCRTIIEHRSAAGTFILSLPIPQPNTPCQMTPGFAALETPDGKISFKETAVVKTGGSDANLRRIVEKRFGKI